MKTKRLVAAAAVATVGLLGPGASAASADPGHEHAAPTTLAPEPPPPPTIVRPGGTIPRPGPPGTVRPRPVPPRPVPPTTSRRGRPVTPPAAVRVTPRFTG
jgi:hypothetical protein